MDESKVMQQRGTGEEKRLKWTQALGVQHEMLIATSPQGTAMGSPAFLLGHGRLELSTKYRTKPPPQTLGKGAEGFPGPVEALSAFNRPAAGW